MNAYRAFRKVALAGCLLFAAGLTHAAPKGCPASAAACVETSSFLATVTNFRTSTQGRNRVVTATVRFENRTNKPLALGYVRDSGIALDDLGNRYAVAGANAVRAIGEVAGTTFDPKFVLQPGEGRDARFELTWEPGKEPVGATFELDLAVREIALVTADQYRLGPGARRALCVARASQREAGRSCCRRCGHASGAGCCEGSVRRIAALLQRRHVHRRGHAGFRLRDDGWRASPERCAQHPLPQRERQAHHSCLPIGLERRARQLRQRLHVGRPGTHDTSVKGIGMLTGRSVDTQFALAPGQSRSATFNIIRFNAAPPIGNAWNYDVVIDEVEVLPGQVVRSARQNSLSFASLTAGTFSGSSAAAGTIEPCGARAAPKAIDVANKVIDLFNRKKKN